MHDDGDEDDEDDGDDDDDHDDDEEVDGDDDDDIDGDGDKEDDDASDSSINDDDVRSDDKDLCLEPGRLEPTLSFVVSSRTDLHDDVDDVVVVVLGARRS